MISPALIQELGVQIIPMEFVMNGKVYHNYPDEHDMSSKEFYRRIRAGEMCTTNQINTATFLELFAPILEGGEDIFYMAFSSGLSGTYNSACMAAQELRARYPEREIVVVDTLAASMGEGLLVYYAVQQKRAGLSIHELEKWVEDNRNHLAHWFTVDDLQPPQARRPRVRHGGVLRHHARHQAGAARGRRGPPHSHGEGARTPPVARRARWST